MLSNRYGSESLDINYDKIINFFLKCKKKKSGSMRPILQGPPAPDPDCAINCGFVCRCEDGGS
jgi:hypothetical protein